MKKLFFSALLLGSLSCSIPAFASKQEAKKDMVKIYGYIEILRKTHDGSYPTIMDLVHHTRDNFSLYGYKDRDAHLVDLQNPDIKLNWKYADMEKLVPYFVINKRADRSPVGSPLKTGEHDLICYTDLYVLPFETVFKGLKASSESGDYLVLWDDGLVEDPPSDTRFYVRVGPQQYDLGFQRQVLPGMDSLSYEEFQGVLFSRPPHNGSPLIAKPKLPDGTIVKDNEGPESLLHLSRRANFPNHYGIDREELWKTFDGTQAKFSLPELQAGATKLGFDTQVRPLSLAQLQEASSPALISLKDDGRIMTLIAIDDDRAVVIDRAVTRNIDRSALEARYGGEALVPSQSLGHTAGIVADDPVREVLLPSLDAEVPESVTLRNTGQKPVTLELEYPLLGVTESKLSKSVLAPGESATLDLKVKWRSILATTTQNVLVSLRTSDEAVPRLQIAFSLLQPDVKTP